MVTSQIVLFLQVAQIVKREMECVVKLYVKLRVKVKVGPSWGNLQDLDIWNKSSTVYIYTNDSDHVLL